MDELEDIKKRKLKELMGQQEDQFAEQQQAQQQIMQLENAVKQFLTKEALERFGNLKTAHGEKALNLLAVLGQMIQNGQIKEKITDSELKEILRQLEPKKKDFNIKRK